METDSCEFESLRWFKSVVNHLGGVKGAKNLMEGKVRTTTAPEGWFHVSDIPAVKIAYSGLSGKSWLPILRSREYRITNRAEALLQRRRSTSCGAAITIAVLACNKSTLSGRSLSSILRHINLWNRKSPGFKFIRPEPEVACHLRELLSDQAIARKNFSSIAVMHRGVVTTAGRLEFLCIGSPDAHLSAEPPSIHTVCMQPEDMPPGDLGLAFVLHQKNLPVRARR